MKISGNDVLQFVKATRNVFSTMLQIEVKCNEPRLLKDLPEIDVSSIIGMSGDVRGAVVLAFVGDTAERLASLFTGMNIKIGDEDFADAIGELVNMVAGGAKANLEGRKISISCPSVIVGRHHQVVAMKGATIIEIPCSTDVGDFGVLVMSEDNNSEGPGIAEQAATVAKA